MFGFFKKNKSKKKTKVLKPKLAKSEIYTIPAQFYGAGNIGLGRQSKIIIALIIAAVIIGAVTSALFFGWFDKPAQDILTNNTNQELDQIEEEVKPEPVKVIKEKKEPEADKEVIEAEPEEEIEETEQEIEEEKKVRPPEEYTRSKDSDNDGLTDVEETLYRTDKNKPDTDRDGYIDGQEIASGYNPLEIAKKIAGSDLVEIYASPLYHYQILYPADWEKKSIDKTGSQMIFRSVNTKEFIEVIVVEGVSSLTKWYQEYVNQQPGTKPIIEDLNNWQIIRSEDKLTVYLGQFGLKGVYIINYNPAGLQELNFRLTFEMMLNSFSLIKAELR